MSPIEIVLRAVGADQVADQFARVATSGQNLNGQLQGVATGANQAGQNLSTAANSASQAGQALNQAGNQLQGATNNITQGANSATGALNGTQNAANQLDASLQTVGDNNGLQAAAEDAEDLSEQVEDSEEKVSGLISTLESIRNAGMVMTGFGVAGIAMSKEFQDAYNEGDRAQQKMEAMLKKRGEAAEIDPMGEWAGKLAEDAFLEDDDPLKEAAAQLMGFGMSAQQVRDIMPGLIGQSRLYNQSLDSTAMALGKAFAAGKAGGLTKIGLTLDKSDIERLNNLEKSGASFAEQQAAMLVVINKSMKQYALSLTEGLTEADKKVNQIAYSMDNLQGAIGEGSVEAQASINGIIASIFNLVNNSPEILKAAGYWGTYASYASAAAGSVLTIGSQVAITAASLKTLGVTGSAVMAALQVGSLGVAASIMAIAAAALIAVAAIAYASIKWNENKDKILNPTQSYNDNRSDQQREDDAQKVETLNDFREQAKKLNPRDRYLVNRKIAQAYIQLGQNDPASELTQETLAQGKTFGSGNKPTAPTDKGARRLLTLIKGLNAGKNQGDRMDGSDFKGYDTMGNGKDDAKKEEDIQKRVDALRKQIAKGATVPKMEFPDADDLSKLSFVDPEMGAVTEREGALGKVNKIRRKQAKSGESDRMKEALSQGVRLDDNGKLFVPANVDVDGIEGDLKASLLRQGKSGNVGYKPSSVFRERPSDARGDSGGSESLSSAELLRYVEGGGSLFNVPGKTSKAGGADGGKGADGSKGARSPRTGEMSLTETGRTRNGDGTETVTVTGTLQLKQSGSTLKQTAMGFRTI